MEKKTDILHKLKNKGLGGEDLTNFFEVLQLYANQSFYAEDELYGWDKILQFIFDDNSQNFFLKTENTLSEHPKLVLVHGEERSPAATIITTAKNFMGIICGGIRYSPEIMKIKGDEMQWYYVLGLIRMMTKELNYF
ncbi:MAG: hypothetical protein ACTSWY_00600 [Promethearchaeota archaeon]